MAVFTAEKDTDFSVMLFRPNFVLASEQYPMKMHKNQQLLTMPSPLGSLRDPCARGQTSVLEVQKPLEWRYMIQLLRQRSSQPIDRKALSWSVIHQSACMLAEITIRKSQDITSNRRVE